MREHDAQSKEGTEGSMNEGRRRSQNLMDTNPQQQPKQSRLLKILADNQSKKQQIIHWSIFFVVTFVTFIVVNFLPHPIKHFNETDNFCTNPIEVDDATRQVTCQPFNLYQRSQKGLAVTNITTLNQFVSLNAYFYLKNTELDLDYKTKANVTLYELEGDGKGKWYTKQLATKVVEYSLTTGKSTKFFSDDGKYMGFDVQLFYIRTIKFSSYLFIVSFPTDAEAVGNLENIRIEASVITKDFSLFSIILRLIFFVVAVAGCIFYIRNLLRISRRYYVLEQKFTLTLALMLTLFNDPFYAITVLLPNDASNFFSVLFVIMLICTLLFFWVCVLERVDKENGQPGSDVMTKWKFLLFTIGCLCILGYYLYFSYKHNSDPFVDISELSSGFFYFLMVSSVLFVLAALLKIIFTFINICKEYEQKIWRNKLLTNFSIFFVFCIFIFLFSNGFEVFSVLPNRILIMFVEVNMYILYLMFMYSPTKDAHQLRLGYLGFEAESVIDQEIKSVVHISMLGKEDEIEEEVYGYDSPVSEPAYRKEEREYPIDVVSVELPKMDRKDQRVMLDSKSVLEAPPEPTPQPRRYSLNPAALSEQKLLHESPPVLKPKQEIDHDSLFILQDQPYPKTLQEEADRNQPDYLIQAPEQPQESHEQQAQQPAPVGPIVGPNLHPAAQSMEKSFEMD